MPDKNSDWRLFQVLTIYGDRMLWCLRPGSIVATEEGITGEQVLLQP